MNVYTTLIISEQGDIDIRLYEHEKDAVDYLVKKRGMQYMFTDMAEPHKRYFRCTNPLKKYRMGYICVQRVIEHV